MARTNLTDSDEGKNVINASGDEIGKIREVMGNRAHVNPDPGLADSVKSKLGWGDSDEDDFVLKEDHIMTITDDEIRLKDQY